MTPALSTAPSSAFCSCYLSLMSSFEHSTKAWASSGEAFPLADHRILFLESTRYTYLHVKGRGMSFMPPGYPWLMSSVHSPTFQASEGTRAAHRHSSIS